MTRHDLESRLVDLCHLFALISPSSHFHLRFWSIAETAGDERPAPFASRPNSPSSSQNMLSSFD